VADSERARLFVALELPAEVRDALVSWRGSVVGEGRGPIGLRQLRQLRLLRNEDLHVTLCFLGWQVTEQIGSILSACAVVAAHPRAELRVSEAIWLPPRRPRVLAVSLEDAGGRLAAVQAVLARTLEAGGWYEAEKRPFLAHVTVARVPGGARPPRGRDLVLAPPPLLTFSGNRVVLYRSVLGPDGARYAPLGSVALSSSPEPEPEPEPGRVRPPGPRSPERS
jgi:2'-5' RNA ligase